MNPIEEEEMRIAAEIARSNPEQADYCPRCGMDHDAGAWDEPTDTFASVRAGHGVLDAMEQFKAGVDAQHKAEMEAAYVRKANEVLAMTRSFFGKVEETHNPPCPRAASCTVCEDADPGIHFQAVSVTDSGARVEILDTCRTLGAAKEACQQFLKLYPDERAIVQVIYDPSTVWESWS